MFFNALAKTKRGFAVRLRDDRRHQPHVLALPGPRPPRPGDRPGRAGRRSHRRPVRPHGRNDRPGPGGRWAPRRPCSSCPTTASSPSGAGVNLNTWLLHNGYLALKAGAEESGEWFKGVDWSRTRAYALGLGGVYINQKGREAQGIVPPAEARALRRGDSEPSSWAQGRGNGRDRNQPGLRQGRNLRRAVQGQRPGPDHRIQRRVPGLLGGRHGKSRDAAVFEDNIKCWSGDHCVDPAGVPGVLFSSLKLASPEPSIMDIAPTVLELFGQARPGPHGRPLAPRPQGTAEK